MTHQIAKGIAAFTPRRRSMVSVSVVVSFIVMALIASALHSAPARSEKVVRSATILIDNRDFEGAKELLGEPEEDDPAQVTYLRAVCEENLGNAADALKAYNRCIESLKGGAVDASLKTKCLAAIKRLDEGKRILAKYAAMMSKEAAPLKVRNLHAHETVMAAVRHLTGDDPGKTAEEALRNKRPPKDAVEFRGHHYKRFPGDFTWRQAKDACEAMGGSLVCIETRDENDFVTSLVRESHVWIGLTDEPKEGEWEWLSGEPVRFVGWGGDEPQNTHDCENACILRRDGIWCDWAEGHRVEFICEWAR